MTDAPTYIVRGPDDHMELLDTRPTWDLLPGQSVWIANVNGGDSRRIDANPEQDYLAILARRVADLAEWNEETGFELRVALYGSGWIVRVDQVDDSGRRREILARAQDGDVNEAAKAAKWQLTESVGDLWHEREAESV
jgi:hypothetical protein